MKTRELHILYGIFAASALIFLLLMLMGCSEHTTEDDSNPFSEMPPDLRTMQGTWNDSNTNDTVECAAIIQGYTIRIRYQADADQPQLKQNASIDRLDESRHLLILNGGTGAWPYALKPDNQEDRLEIEFFGTDGWHRMQLCRAD